MPQAIGDPEKLERFALSLVGFIDNLDVALSQLNQEFEALGETWQDEKRAQFEEEYDSLLQQLTSFRENTEDQVPHLQALASRLRDYLQS